MKIHTKKKTTPKLNILYVFELLLFFYHSSPVLRQIKWFSVSVLFLQSVTDNKSNSTETANLAGLTATISTENFST